MVIRNFADITTDEDVMYLGTVKLDETITKKSCETIERIFIPRFKKRDPTARTAPTEKSNPKRRARVREVALGEVLEEEPYEKRFRYSSSEEKRLQENRVALSVPFIRRPPFVHPHKWRLGEYPSVLQEVNSITEEGQEIIEDVHVDPRLADLVVPFKEQLFKRMEELGNWDKVKTEYPNINSKTLNHWYLKVKRSNPSAFVTSEAQISQFNNQELKDQVKKWVEQGDSNQQIKLANPDVNSKTKSYIHVQNEVLTIL